MEDNFVDVFTPSADLTDFVPGEWSTELAGGSIGLSQSVIGDPAGDAAIWNQQDTPFTCAVVCQQMILDQFGLPISEAQLVYDATINGWLSDGGTSLLDVGALLEHYGVPTHTNFAGDVESLANELIHGHKVIVAVDSGEMWGTDFPFADWLNPNGADHAIVITGMDLSDADNPLVFVNDPGDPEGAGRPYPLSQFLDAWQDSGNMYVATDHAPDGLANHSVFGSGFNPDTGMYADGDFWKDFLVNVGIPVAVEAMTGFVVPPAAVNVVWETMSDAARNDLFLNV